MTSSPPISTRPLGLPRLLRRGARGASGEPAGLCFAVTGAPPGADRSVPRPGGGLTLLTEVSGHVVAVEREQMVLEVFGTHVRVRHLLPRPAVSLRNLRGHTVRVEVRHELSRDPSELPTVDARLLTPEGTLLLWARDGALPTEPPVDAAAIRVRCDGHGVPRLAVAWRGDVTSAAPAQMAEVGVEPDRLLVLPLRVTAGQAAFVLARGG